MTISGIVLDEFASEGGKVLQYLTIGVVTLCFLLSFSLFIIRLQQVIAAAKKESKDETFCTKRLLQICHLSAMFFSCLYIFLYEWNYVHLYRDYNAVNCTVWFVLIMISITFSKVFIYSFLMLRSSLSFTGSMFEIPLKLSISVTVISVTSQIIMMALMLSDFTAISPYPTSSLCFRLLGPNGTVGITGFNVSDALSNTIALIIFWRKSASVKSLLFDEPNVSNATVNRSTSEINSTFKKHILLGMLIIMGSILIFSAGEFLTILMGLASTLHQLANNIYIFLLFRENNTLYNVVCCRCYPTKKEEMILQSCELAVHVYGTPGAKPKVTKQSSNTCSVPSLTSVPSVSSQSMFIPRNFIIGYKKHGSDMKSRSLIEIDRASLHSLEGRNSVKRDTKRRKIVGMDESQRRSTIVKLNINTNEL